MSVPLKVMEELKSAKQPKKVVLQDINQDSVLHESPPKLPKKAGHTRTFSEAAPAMLRPQRDTASSNRLTVFDNEMHNRVMSMMYDDGGKPGSQSRERKVLKKSQIQSIDTSNPP